MIVQIEILLAFLLYLLFFAWNGRRRGMISELIVLIVAVGAWFALPSIKSIVVVLTNLGSKFVQLVLSGNLSGDLDTVFAALKDTSDAITSENEQTYLFLLWVLIVLLVYVATTLIKLKSKKNRGGAMLVGILNGLFFAGVLLPRLSAVLAPKGYGQTQVVAHSNIGMVIKRVFAVIEDGFGAIIELIKVPTYIVFLLGVTLLLFIVVSSLGSSKSRKSKSSQSRGDREDNSGRSSNNSSSNRSGSGSTAGASRSSA